MRIEHRRVGPCGHWQSPGTEPLRQSRRRELRGSGRARAVGFLRTAASASGDDDQHGGQGDEREGTPEHAVVYPPVFLPLVSTRRTFLKTAAAACALPARALTQTRDRETLYNGVVLPLPWPPARVPPTGVLERPPYLITPPAVIDVDIGRQLFVDDFLIEESGLHREFHAATYHPASPILTPQRDWEIRDPYSINAKVQPSPTAMVFSDGVFFDPEDQLFKLWYMAGYQQATALVTSRDGITWERPRLPVVPGTNIVWPFRRDSSAVWLDLDAPTRASRFKMAAYVFETGRLKLSESPDGIRWNTVGDTGPCGDRSTFFRNPFRKQWVFSLRADDSGTVRRYRRYFESSHFAQATWSAGEPVSWVATDTLDFARPDLKMAAELYNVDAVAYESVMLGLFTVFRGEYSNREKPNDICVAFSRDGFHWDRSARQPFISVSETAGAWNYANVQSAGGCCLIVGDRLYFYCSGRQGIDGTNLPGRCSTGLATIRRDGFASLSDQWPAGVARRVWRDKSSAITRPLRFTGTHLFVNADATGEIRVEVLDRSGRVVPGYSADDCVPVRGDHTRQAVTWRTRPDLAAIKGEIVRLRFSLSRARVFAFWIAQTAAGRSRGYVAAGGPGFTRSSDNG